MKAALCYTLTMKGVYKMSKSELFTFIMAAADRANEMLVIDREFNYQSGIDFSKFLNHVLQCCEAASCIK